MRGVSDPVGAMASARHVALSRGERAVLLAPRRHFMARHLGAVATISHHVDAPCVMHSLYHEVV